MDLVQLTLGDRKLRFYYPTAMKLSGQMRVLAKAGVTVAGASARFWRELAKYECEPPTEKLNREYRRSGYLSNVKKWDLDIEGELVVLRADDLFAKFHCTYALILQAMLLRAARDAKLWAGDSWRGLIVSAHLTNATPNVKAGAA